MKQCIKKINDSEIKCEENKLKFILLNTECKFVDFIKVDGCIYPRGHNELCCDFALNHGNKTIFIELKGSKVAHATKQILATYKDAKFPINPHKVAIIVTRRFPITDTSIQIEMNKLYKLGFKLFRRNSPFEKSLSEF